MRIKTISFKSRYWKPDTDFTTKIIEAVSHRLEEGDMIVVSEKALSTACSNIVNESIFKPSSLAFFLSSFWVRKVWAGPLGWATGLRKKTLENLRTYPVLEGASHKQVTLKYAGFLQSLRHYSEGGIDASNLPYSYVSLPLKKPWVIADKIRNAVTAATGKTVTVLIVDGDTTYSWRNIHLAPRKVSTPGLIHIGGFTTFVVGRLLGLKERQTPVALSGQAMNPDRALWYARLYHKLCGGGAGRTVWSMSTNMDTTFTGVTWEMLEAVDHYPLSIIRIIEN
jgi:F420-0:gamma-glutamyl ligase-like protein